MARDVLIRLNRLSTTGKVPAKAKVRFTPTVIRADAEGYILDDYFDVIMVNGEGTANDLPETDLNWAYKVEVKGHGAGAGLKNTYDTWYVHLPAGEGAVNFEDLPRIDPTTLTPVNDPDPAWVDAVTAVFSDSISTAVEPAMVTAVDDETSEFRSRLNVATDKRIADYGVSVKTYGAIGDGVANDTAAIQAALDNETTVYIPAGTYNITAPLTVKKDNFTLNGAGKKLTTIFLGDPNNNALLITDRANVEARGIRVATGPAGATVSGAGISVVGSSRDVRIISCATVGFSRAGIRIGETGTIAAGNIKDPANVKIIDCDIIDAPRTGIETMRIKGVEIRGCVITGLGRASAAGHGIRLAGAEKVIVHSTFISGTKNGIVHHGWGDSSLNTKELRDVLVFGNQIEDCESGLTFEQTVCSQVQESNNVITNTTYGIRLEGRTDGATRDIAFKNNIIKGNGQGVVSFTLTGLRHVLFEGNEFVDNTSHNFNILVGDISPQGWIIKGNTFKCSPAVPVRGLRVFSAKADTVITFMFNDFYTPAGTVDYSIVAPGVINSQFNGVESNKGYVY